MNTKMSRRTRETNPTISKRLAMFWSLSLTAKYPIIPPNMLRKKAITYHKSVGFDTGEVLNWTSNGVPQLRPNLSLSDTRSPHFGH